MGFLCLGLPIAIASIALAGRWVLHPMQEASLWVALPRRFYLSDFVWLMVLLQAAFAGIAWVPQEERAIRIVLGIFFVGAVVAVWTAATNTLSKAGIFQPLRRGLFLLLVLPAVLFLMGGIAIWLLVLFAGFEAIAADDSAVWASAVVGGFVGGLLALWLLRQAMRWIVNGAVSPASAEANQCDRAMESDDSLKQDKAGLATIERSQE